MGKFKNFWNKHGTSILTSLSVGGVILTGISSARATVKAVRMLDAAEDIKGEPLDTREKITVAAQYYILPTIVGAASIGTIIANDNLSAKQKSALIAGYSAVHASYAGLKEKVREEYGDEAAKDIIRTAAKQELDRLDKIDILPNDDEVLFYDEFFVSEKTHEHLFTAHYFEVQDAIELIANKKLARDGFVSMNDIYGSFGKRSETGDVLGYSEYYLFEMYGERWIDIYIDPEPITLDDGLEVFIIRYNTDPDENFLD